MKEVKAKDKAPFERNFVDRVIEIFNPVSALKRYKSRASIGMAEAWVGASKTRRALSDWLTSYGDSDSEDLPELPDLRKRCRDLYRNNALASGSINTKVTTVVGTGLSLQSRVDRNILGMSEEEADKLETLIEAEWALWADSKDCDITRTSTFKELQEIVYRSVLNNGDVFVLTPSVKRIGCPYDLRVQLIEADRVSNPGNTGDSEKIAAGIEVDKFGAFVAAHIQKGHPGNSISDQTNWKRVEAFSKSGRRNLIHLFHRKRIGQRRGIPDLSTVIELIKQLGRYTEAEVMAAVISACFTVFIESETDGALDISTDLGTETGATSTDKDYKMAPGAILDMIPGEKVTIADPKRPNTALDPFVQAILRQIGVSLELPFEILVKHFTSSYTASRAAINELWRFVSGRRKWLSDGLCRLIYELWFTEAVAKGRIHAPGFLNGDPLIKAAYLGSDWTGPAKGQINEFVEIRAAAQRVELGVSTLSQETSEINGGNWDKNHQQRVKEVKARRADGLETELEQPNQQPFTQEPQT